MKKTQFPGSYSLLWFLPLREHIGISRKCFMFIVERSDDNSFWSDLLLILNPMEVQYYSLLLDSNVSNYLYFPLKNLTQEGVK